jgi:hypothetical protein
LKKLLLAAIAAIAPLCAQTILPTCSGSPSLCSAAYPVADVQIKPQAIPTSQTTIAGADVFLKSVVLSNPTGSAITVTLADKQGTPVSLLGAVSVAANTTYVMTFPANAYYWCPGGFTIQASASGATFYAAWQR